MNYTHTCSTWHFFPGKSSSARNRHTSIILISDKISKARETAVNLNIDVFSWRFKHSVGEVMTVAKSVMCAWNSILTVECQSKLPTTISRDKLKLNLNGATEVLVSTNYLTVCPILESSQPNYRLYNSAQCPYFSRNLTYSS